MSSDVLLQRWRSTEPPPELGPGRALGHGLTNTQSTQKTKKKTNHPSFPFPSSLLLKPLHPLHPSLGEQSVGGYWMPPMADLIRLSGKC